MDMVRVGRLVSAALGAVLFAAACSSDGFTYIENKDEGLYFKVPDEWVVSESRGVIETPAAEFNRAIDGLNDPDLPAQPEPWRVSIGGTTSELPGPRILVEVVPVGSDVRDDVSIRWLKSQATEGLDPTSEAAIEQGFTVVYDQDLVQGDLSGNRIVVDLVTDGGTPLTIDQLIYVDPAITRLYRMVVLCDANCYRDYFDDIEVVMNSFTVES